MKEQFQWEDEHLLLKLKYWKGHLHGCWSRHDDDSAWSKKETYEPVAKVFRKEIWRGFLDVGGGG